MNHKLKAHRTLPMPSKTHLSFSVPPPENLAGPKLERLVAKIGPSFVIQLWGGFLILLGHEEKMTWCSTASGHHFAVHPTIWPIAFWGLLRGCFLGNALVWTRVPREKKNKKSKNHGWQTTCTKLSPFASRKLPRDLEILTLSSAPFGWVRHFHRKKRMAIYLYMLVPSICVCWLINPTI